MTKLYTIGHSTHTIKELICILKAHEITDVIDIRTVPKSRHAPWFNKDSLNSILLKADINYTHMPQLGGLRHPQKNSINMGWRNASFRGFADYMQTLKFYQALKDLNKIIKDGDKVVIMCSEAVPWRCHRSLIADAEIVRGIKVFHIMSKTQLNSHEMTPFAVVNKTKRPIRVNYPSEK